MMPSSRVQTEAGSAPMPCNDWLQNMSQPLIKPVRRSLPRLLRLTLFVIIYPSGLCRVRERCLRFDAIFQVPRCTDSEYREI
jgi:hypothetical protein